MERRRDVVLSVYRVVEGRLQMAEIVGKFGDGLKADGTTGWILLWALDGAIGVGRHVYLSLEAAQAAADEDGNTGAWQEPWTPMASESRWKRQRTSGTVVAQEVVIHQ